MANALAIEEEENQRELSERIRKQELRQQDEFTNNQIRYVLFRLLSTDSPVRPSAGLITQNKPRFIDTVFKTFIFKKFKLEKCARVPTLCTGMMLHDNTSHIKQLVAKFYLPRKIQILKARKKLEFFFETSC